MHLFTGLSELPLRRVTFRVTRLVEFSPIGRLFSLGRFLKIAEVALILGHFFPRETSYVCFDKNGLGYTLGDFFSQTHLVTLATLEQNALFLSFFFFSFGFFSLRSRNFY
jgi:hypothetical protein